MENRKYVNRGVSNYTNSSKKSGKTILIAGWLLTILLDIVCINALAQESHFSTFCIISMYPLSITATMLLITAVVFDLKNTLKEFFSSLIR